MLLLSILRVLTVFAAWFWVSAIVQAGQQIDKFTSDDVAAGDQFGIAIDLENDISLIGASQDDDNGNHSGSAYIFKEDSTGNWSQIITLTVNDAAANDQFGAAVSLSGKTALIGAFGDESNAGSAYVFQEIGGWSQSEKFTASDVKENDRFGTSVSLDSTVALVGAPFGNKSSLVNVGAAYIFEDDGQGDWLQKAKLNASDATMGEADNFGAAVALDGNLAIVGAPLKDAEVLDDSGAAYLFENDGQGNWSEIAKLTASDAQLFDNFGFAVALQGNTALVGAPFGDKTLLGDEGAVYVFRDDGMGNWQEIDKLTASNGAQFDQFGTSVDLDNGKALIGASLHGGTLPDAGPGTAYLFEDDGSGNWNEIKQLTANDATDGDQFGAAVAISGDTSLVGAPTDDARGSSYVFKQIALDADFNGDMTVDGTDLTFWKAGFGFSFGATRTNGDADEDGDVDGNDFLIWQRQRGNSALAVSILTVPEPNSVLLSLFIVATEALLCRRQTKPTEIMSSKMESMDQGLANELRVDRE